jgi:hypothetical protein
MTHSLLFELEKTLVDPQGKVFAHVLDALKTMKSFQTETGENLLMCLISVGRDGAGGDDTFQGLASRLETLGLKSFFDPLERKVNLIPRADTQGLGRHLFETALSRSASDATLEQCVFFTGDHDAARVARGLNMKTFEFSPSQDGKADFADWLEAPLLVAKIVCSNRPQNTELALRAYLAATENMDLVSLMASSDPDALLGKVSTWHAITSEKLKDLSGVNVKLPAQIRVQLDASGKVKKVDRTEPAPTDQEEAAHFVESLAMHGQIASGSGVTLRDATHQISTDNEGRRYLVRKRFSAV